MALEPHTSVRLILIIMFEMDTLEKGVMGRDGEAGPKVDLEQGRRESSGMFHSFDFSNDR